MRGNLLLLVLAALAVALLVPPALAQEGQPAGETASPPPIDWQAGPTTARLGDLATIQIPEGLAFADGDGARKLLELTRNVPSGGELGVVVPMSEEGSGWFLIFDFSDVGYVKDDERDKLDAEGMLKNLQEGTRQSNDIRKQRGFPTIELTGWEKPPFYDPKTNNLTWGTRVVAEGGGSSVNYSTRLLGRNGYMNVDLVIDPEGLQAALPAFDALISGFTYTEGNRYAEFKAGDKVATYGLSALIVGGAAAAAIKTGLLARFWKWIVVAGAAAVAAVRKFFRKATTMAETPPPGPEASPGA